jgi:hypothetical protein
LPDLSPPERTRICDELRALTAIEGTSGDESRILAAVAERCAPLPGLRSERIQDNLIVWRGRPQVALFAHMDTVGFTLGYERELIRIGAVCQNEATTGCWRDRPKRRPAPAGSMIRRWNWTR